MPPRRPRRPLPPRRFDHRKPATRNVHPTLLRANKLFSNGKYIDAAALYEKMAVGAYDRNLPRAPMLFMQSGKALLIAGKVQRGMSITQRGLGILADQSRLRELYQFGRRSINILNELGYEKEAQGMEEWLKTRLPEKEEAAIKAAHESSPTDKPNFPITCPACGARVHPDEVRVIDGSTVECSFCGSIMRSK
jgi:hypothetical protein